jgi:predicted DNA-binding transcriptional regulator AlpA
LGPSIAQDIQPPPLLSLQKSEFCGNALEFCGSTSVIVCPTISKPTDKAMTTTQKTAQPDEMLTPDEAAAVLKMSKSWLAKARLTGNGPPYHKLGGSIRYSRTALLQWIKANLHMSTSG